MAEVHKHSITLCLVCVCICLDLTTVHCATVTGNDQTGLLGDNPLTLTCAFTVDAYEYAISLSFRRRRQTESYFSEVALFNVGANLSVYTDATLQDRTVLMLMDGSANLKFSRLECNDAATYKCFFQYSSNQIVQTFDDDMNLVIEAKPLSPVIIPSYRNPNRKTFVEDEELEMRCVADVGLPAGTFKWFGYKTGTTPVDLTSSAIDGNPTSNSGPRYCAFSRESTLKLNLTRENDGLMIRCVVSQKTLGPPPVADGLCADVPCKQTGAIVVEYPIRQQDIAISICPAMTEYIVGSSVTMRCAVDGNPAPVYRWKKDEAQNVNFNGNTLDLTNLQFGDGGTYTCLANNIINGAAFNASKSILIRVGTQLYIYGATVMTSEDQVGLLGNYSLSLSCVFTLDEEETFRSLELSRRTEEGFWISVAQARYLDA